MFRLNLYLPLVVVTILMALLTVVAIIYIQENSIHKSKASISRQFTDNLNEKVSLEAAVIGEYIEFMQNKDEITNLFYCGRMADYKYYNMDQALARALVVSEKIGNTIK